MSRRVVVLTGGVGGAKLVDGLYRVLPPDTLSAIVNTGDDFRHFGLPISPDIDTLLYTLSGKANRSLGWGREGESWQFMAALRSLGGDDWFQLGDGDLALHVMRGAALAAGARLTDITRRFAAAWGLKLDVLPMTDDPLETWVDSDEGALAFQQYFVHRRCEPTLKAVHFRGAAQARPTPEVLAAIAGAEVILIAPSNPWLSIDPILAVPGLRDAVIAADAPVVLVSPLVEGKAVKGPTAKLMAELGLNVSNEAIAAHYGELVGGLVVHQDDAAPQGYAVARTDTLMKDEADRCRVAEVALQLADHLRG